MYDYFLLSVKTLSHRKARTVLTLMGVIIGIMAVVSMISVGSGMKATLKEQLQSLGSDKIIITPKFSYGTKAGQLNDDDSRAIGKLPGVAFVSPIFSVSTSIEFGGQEKNIIIFGMDPGKAENTFGNTGGYSLLQGRWLSKGDQQKVVIGYGIHNDLFSRKVNVGNTIKIRGKTFEVVGIFQKTGDRTKDYTLYTNIDQLRELVGAKNSLTMIIAKAQKGVNVEDVRIRIENLIKNRKESSKNYFVATQKEIFEKASVVFKIVQVVFGGLAAVSLIVGAIGISNTMIMNVTERVREIGIIKAIGASDSQVMKIFMADALVVGFTGGIIGIALGYATSIVINMAASVYLGNDVLKTTVSPSLAAFALIFAVVIGAIAGLYPAYRASKLNPVDSLRS
ncbi:MAG TPA: ABC transporter permease [Euryarchaeota archaeon]|nr:ABC transporter permease [Euryarchaeota archaeon]